MLSFKHSKRAKWRMETAIRGSHRLFSLPRRWSPVFSILQYLHPPFLSDLPYFLQFPLFLTFWIGPRNGCPMKNRLNGSPFSWNLNNVVVGKHRSYVDNTVEVFSPFSRFWEISLAFAWEWKGRMEDSHIKTFYFPLFLPSTNFMFYIAPPHAFLFALLKLNSRCEPFTLTGKEFSMAVEMVFEASRC